MVSHNLYLPSINIQGFCHGLEKSINEIEAEIETNKTHFGIKNEIHPLLTKKLPELFPLIQAGIIKMVIGLLKVLRLDRIAFCYQKLNMNEMIREVLKNYKFYSKEKYPAVHVTNLPSSYGEAAQLIQLFANLIEKTIKYLHPNRAGEISDSKKNPGKKATCCVSNNGIGIAKEHREKVFEKFYWLEHGNPEK